MTKFGDLNRRITCKTSHLTYFCPEIEADVVLTVTSLSLSIGDEIVMRLDCDCRERCGIAKSACCEGISHDSGDCPAYMKFLGGIE